MFDDQKTIFALATAPGKSGVAIIRISGPEALNCLIPLTKKPLPEARKAILRDIINPITNQLIDQAVILTFAAPNSFTGEDIVELQIHGSRAVINILLKVLAGFNNFRMAEPGEFAKRAFLNGRMDLTAAEGLADLIEAETLVQQQQAIRQVQGELAGLYDSWKAKLIHALALLEAYIDFPEEDIPANVIDEVNNIVAYMQDSLALHLNDSARGEIIRRGIYVTILGAPNVGKSSLLNYLAKRDVAIVSSTAGTTRDIIEVNLDLGGYPVTIADTAGIRESEDAIEQEGVSRALSKAGNADIKVIMLAVDDPNSNEILSMKDENSIILLNKIDKTNLSIEGAIAISVKQNIGLDQFLEKLSSLIDKKFASNSDPILTRERHRYYLNLCLENLSHFTLLNQLELACEDLRLAARALGQIVGVIDVETILDEIFINFCIGK
jgi:tRNA modification GTPase